MQRHQARLEHGHMTLCFAGHKLLRLNSLVRTRAAPGAKLRPPVLGLLGALAASRRRCLRMQCHQPRLQHGRMSASFA
jgi:hypothetical protein